MRTCGECGGTSHLLKPHKETCSRYVHLIDDHYDSPCMRGTCKHCNPGYEPTKSVNLTQKECTVLAEVIRIVQKMGIDLPDEDIEALEMASQKIY